MSKRFPKPEITLDGIYSKFADESFCKDFLLDIRFEKRDLPARFAMALSTAGYGQAICCASSSVKQIYPPQTAILCTEHIFR